MRNFLWLTLTVSLATAVAVPAWAQAPGGGSLSESGIRSGAPKAPRVEHQSEAPPPAVPGAIARPDSVAPAERGAADLPPTEALFDAINRGDIVSARDAISRGADLDGTNLLGLTPLELSVDLGRNDISFLLLSLRGPSDRATGTPQETSAPLPATSAQRRRAQQDAQAEARLARKQEAAATKVSAPAPRAPALFAGNGGTPVPQAGFLGFDPHH